MPLRCNGADRAVRDRRHNLAQCLDADIACRKDAFDTRLLFLVRNNIAVLVQYDLITEQSGIREIAGKDKDAERLSFFCRIMLHLSRRAVAEIGTGDHRLTVDALHNGVEAHLDIRIVGKRIHCCLGRAELVAAHEYGDGSSVARKEHALLHCRKTAADDEDVHPGKEFRIASCAVGNAAPLEFLLSEEAHLARICSRGKDDAQRLYCTRRRLKLLNILIEL